MFVRVKTTPNSPRRSVQIVESVREGAKVRQRIVHYVGIALDAEEEGKLKAMAAEQIQKLEARRLSEGGLFETRSDDITLRRRGRPKRTQLEEVAGVDAVVLGDLFEESRRVEGPEEALGGLYSDLGFDRILRGKRANRMLCDLVLARIMEPASKRRTQSRLAEHWGRCYDLDAVYRLLDQVAARLPELKKAVLASTLSLTQGQVNVLLFDVTTLYFESVAADDLRAFGYSKDQKYHCTQVVLALATNEDGLPIGYELFPGNTAEVNTLLGSLDHWKKQLKLDTVTFVADRALCSRRNLKTLQDAGARYVVAFPLRRSLKAVEAAAVREVGNYTQYPVEDQLLWVGEFTHEEQRLIVTYSATRARKDVADRQAILKALQTKLGKPQNGKKLISNRGYLKYIEPEGQPGSFVFDEDKIAEDASWDGLHAIITNDFDTPATELLSNYRRLWVIEESFRIHKHNLAIRPIYHFKPERIKAHIGLCFLAFALMRQALQRIRLAKRAISPQELRDALINVQASILKHKKTGVRYRMPSRFSQQANAIYKALGISRNNDPSVVIS